MTVTRTRAMGSSAIVFALSLAVPSAAAAAATAHPAPLSPQEIHWRGRPTAVGALAAELGQPNANAVAGSLDRYDEWVEANDYHVALSEDGRVVLITKSKKASKRRMKLVEEALDAFDALLAPPDRSASEESFVVAEWGVGDHVPDAEPVVLIEVEGADRYRSLLTGIGAERPQLEGWARSQFSQPGFAEERVSTAAWQAAPDGFEVGDVWRSENELVNRLARLLVHRSFGPQPTWLRIGCAWRVEMAVQGSIYCFPYRQEFVGVGEHGGWEADLKRAFKKRKKRPLEVDEFASWRRNRWSDEHAQLAWGFVEYLARHEPTALPEVAEAFRERYKAGFRTTHDDGTWSTDPTFQVPMDAQLEVLRSSAGEDVMERATAFFRAGKRYRPRKRRG
ncbi:MAG: hypothetical protein AAF957_14420 [Planctomycetota bacterium]